MGQNPPLASLTRLAGLAERVANAVHADEGLSAVVQTTKEIFHAQTVAILLVAEGAGHLHIKASRGLGPQYAAQFKRPLGAGIAAEVVLGGLALVLSDAAANHEERDELRLENDFGSAMVAPITINQRPAGYFHCDHCQGGRFQREDLLLFRALASIAALAVERLDLQEKVSRLAVEDPVTGLFTYGHFHSRLTYELTRALRYDEAMGLLLVSVRNLAQIADAHSEASANEVLRWVGVLLKENIRAVDFAARLSHNEIIVCLVRADEEGLAVVSERLSGLARKCRVTSRAERDAGVAVPHEPVETEEVDVSLYLAGVVAPENGRDAATLLLNLQAALLSAKLQGPGQLVLYED